jgi:hypothetical protein
MRLAVESACGMIAAMAGKDALERDAEKCDAVFEKHYAPTL